MTATVIEFPSGLVRRSHRTRGVCMYCLGWYPDLTDFNCYGLGKWCDGCEPILKDVVQRAINGEEPEKIRTQVESFWGPRPRPAVDEAGSPR
jgi:hypothetical protein